MPVIQNNISAIVIVFAVLFGVLLVFAGMLYWRLRRAEMEYEFLSRGTEGQNLVEIVNDNIQQARELLVEVNDLSELYNKVIELLAGAIQHVGVVRFDAFRDIGGLMSFSIAMLDDRGNGLTITSIYGRAESRTYCKPVVERGSSYELSPEEMEAIRLAMQSGDRGAYPVVTRDADHEEKIATLKLFHDKEIPAARVPERGIPVKERKVDRGAPPAVAGATERNPRRGEQEGDIRPSRRVRPAEAGSGQAPGTIDVREEREQELARRRLEQAMERQTREQEYAAGNTGKERSARHRASRSDTTSLDSPVHRLRGPGGNR